MATTLPVVEKFHSLQGEGAHAGRSAYFIRLASCNVKCPWCDTKNSWATDLHPQETIEQLSASTSQANKLGANFIIITGGEPLHHNLNPLCEKIREITLTNNKMKMPIHIETSGVDSLSGNPDWITLSPKKHALPTAELLRQCDELKIVIHEKEDIQFAEKMAQDVKLSDRSKGKALFFLQPGWDSQEGQNLAFEFVRSHSEWRLSIQTHKWLGIL